MGDSTSSKIRILRIVTRMNIGGPALHVGLLSMRLDRTRFSTWVVVGSSDEAEGDLSALLDPSAGVEAIRLPQLRRAIRPWADAACLIRLVHICARVRPHIIHTHMAKAGTLGRLAGMLYNAVYGWRGDRARLVHTFHGHVLEGYFSPRASRLFTAIERWLGARTDCLIAVSPTIRQAILAKGIGPPERVRVVRLGLELAGLDQLEFPNGRRPLCCGLIGRLVPIKNPTMFVEAMARAAGRLPERSLAGLIVGDGPLRPDVEAAVEARGLGGHIRLTGWRRDLPECYGELDALCLTSWNEGTPVSVIEAMAAGRAVVATDVGGVRDLLQDPADPRPAVRPGEFVVARRGLLVGAGDVEGLAGALATLCEEPALRRRLGEAARAYALSAHRAERLLDEIGGLYESLVDPESVPSKKMTNTQAPMARQPFGQPS